MTFEDLKEVCEGYICRKTDPFVSAHLPPGNFNHVTFPMTEMKSSDNAASHFLELHDYKEDINFADLSHAYKAAMDRNDLQMLPAPFGLKEKVGGDTMLQMVITQGQDGPNGPSSPSSQEHRRKSPRSRRDPDGGMGAVGQEVAPGPAGRAAHRFSQELQGQASRRSP